VTDPSAASGPADPSAAGGPVAVATTYDAGGLQGDGLVVGAKLGGAFHQPFGDLGSAFLGELELGWRPPLPAPVGRDVELFLDFGYDAPSADGRTAADPRLGGATAKYALKRRALVLTAGALYRLDVGGELRPYASLGVRTWLADTSITGEAGGERFGEHHETSTEVGPAAALGLDWLLGPGAALLELQVSHAGIDDRVLRDSSAGALGVGVGYRIFL
jgi:opacity protein-like surface antigen